MMRQTKVRSIGMMPYYAGYAGRTGTVGSMPYYSGYAGRTGTVGSMPSFSMSQRAYNPAGTPGMTNRVQVMELNPVKTRIRGYGTVPAANLPYSTSRSVELARLRPVSGVISDAYDNIVNGEWSALWRTLTGTEQQQSKELSAKIYELNTRLYTSGRWTKAQFDQASKNLAKDNPDDYIAQIQSAAKEGADEATLAAADSVISGIKTATAGMWKITTDVVGAALSGLATTTPWWVWAGLALYVASYLGVFQAAKGSVARRYGGYGGSSF
jgi:hypothetical protein